MTPEEFKHAAWAAANTQSILDACDHHGVTLISIGRKTERITRTLHWPYGHARSIFCEGEHNNWPAAWAVAKRAGVSSGTGNSDQHQIKGPVIPGVYEKTAGEWEKIE